MLNGTQVGPYKIEDVQGWIKAGYVKMDDPAWYDECDDWITVQEIPKINEITAGHTVGGHLVPPFEAYNGDEPYIFISYAHKDSAEVFKEISQLNEAGYHIWYDEGIEASSEWPEEIANAVIGCSAFLVFISPRSTSSVNCRNEINLALNEDKPFLAVHMEESALPPGLRLRMGDLQAILKFKLPEERYQKKVSDALDQLLGKKKKKIRSRPATATATTFAKMESNDRVRVTGNIKREAKKKVKTIAQSSVVQRSIVQSSKKKSGLWLGLAIALIALIGGYSFLNQEEQDGVSVTAFVEGKPWAVPSIGLEMNWCEPGVFYMGSLEKEKGRNQDETRHEVTLTQGFFLGKFEVTQEEWKTVMGSSPSKYFGPKRPVENISWDQAKRFCQELSLIEKRAGRLPKGWSYDLPTEAQWEYACRAGTTSTFYWGNAIGPSHANFKGAGVRETTAVGQYPPNPWGFYDMLGNVAEFCFDYYQPFSAIAKIDPIIVEASNYRVDRGNSFIDNNVNTRIARRLKKNLSYRGKTGFRLCLKEVSVPEKPVEGKPWTVPSIGLKMIWCKPGTFMAGSPGNELGRDESEDQKKISLKKGFFLGKYEVTQKQFRDLMGINPQSAYKKDDNPVLNVTWVHLLGFCNRLTETERKEGRLPKDWFYGPPSEAQWEYACRAGTTTAYSWGKEIDPKFSNYKTTRPFGPKVVGSYPPNNWGFYDMLGNVQEWCSDTKLRGGSWNSSKFGVRSASLGNHAKFGGTTGFRVSLQKK